MNSQIIKEYLGWIVLIIEAVVLAPSIYHYFQGNNQLTIYLLLICVFILAIYLIYQICQGSKIKYAYDKNESIKIIRKIIKQVYIYLKKDPTHTICIYEANLQTTNPKNILKEDSELSKCKYKVKWIAVILETSEKLEWIEHWKREIKNVNDLCELYLIKTKDINWPLINIYTIPSIGHCYIGFAEYENIGLNGGGIWIKNKATANEFQKIVKGLLKSGEEV